MDDRTTQAKDALERDWEQTKHDAPGLEGEDLDQDVDDTVRQALGRERVPDKDERSR